MKRLMAWLLVGVFVPFYVLSVAIGFVCLAIVMPFIWADSRLRDDEPFAVSDLAAFMWYDYWQCVRTEFHVLFRR